MKFRYILTMLACLTLVICAVQPVMAEADSSKDNATSYYNIAEAAINIGQYDKAVQYFDMVLAENTTLISKGDALMYTYKDKAGALTDLGRYDEALTTVNAGLVQFRNSTGMWNNKGYVLYKMGRYNDAVDAYTQAVTIDPSYVKGWINKGNALAKAGRYQEAADAYNKVLTLDPGNQDATKGLTAAEQNAGTAPSTTIIILVVIVILAAGLAVWYIKFRKSEPGDKKDKSAEKKTK